MFGPETRSVSPVTSTTAPSAAAVGIATTSTASVPYATLTDDASVTVCPSIVKVDSDVSVLSPLAFATWAKLPNPVAGSSTSNSAARMVVALEASALYAFFVIAIFFIFVVSSLR